MADVQNDGRGNKYIGSIPEGLVAAELHAAQLDRELAEKSARELPQLTRRLEENGILFSKDRKCAIFVAHGNVQLRRKKKDGFPLQGYAEISSKLIFSRRTLLSLFELMEQEQEQYPGREEWS